MSDIRLLVIYNKLNINIYNSCLYKLLKENNLPLYSLSSDLCEIFKNPTTSKLYTDYFLLDMSMLNEETYSDITIADLIIDITVLLNLIADKYADNFNNNDNGILKSITLELPDTVIFEYLICKRTI